METTFRRTRAAYRNWKPSGVAPKRDLTGIWDTVQTLGVSGILEHTALFPGGRGQEGGARMRRASNIAPVYAGGPGRAEEEQAVRGGVRQVELGADQRPAGKCDPLGFPYMFTWEFRTINVVQTPKQVVMLSPFYGNYRVVWTDGRKPPADPDPRYNATRWATGGRLHVMIETTGMLA
jgi:hypothetical protein